MVEFIVAVRGSLSVSVGNDGVPRIGAGGISHPAAFPYARGHGFLAVRSVQVPRDVPIRAAVVIFRAVVRERVGLSPHLRPTAGNGWIRAGGTGP
jgi:hypothetical protein